MSDDTPSAERDSKAAGSSRIPLGDAASRLDRALRMNLGTCALGGNRITPLRNGDQIFPAMLKAIDDAERTVEFLTYVYWTGDIARRFAEALARAARRGVAVRVLLDGLGAAPMDEDLQRLIERAGVDVGWFRPPVRWKVWEVDNRTHRKVLVCDERLGFTGGVGIGSEWEGDARGPDEWRDTHFEIRGPAVLPLKAAFLTNWLETGKPGVSEADGVASVEDAGGASIHVIRSAAAIGWSDMSSLMRCLIVSARRHLRIQTAYFVPDETAVRLLIGAVERGVDVEVMLPGPHTDSRISQLASEDCFARLLDGGVKLWSYRKTMLHVKAITIDGVAACVGSPNFNHRSMLKDDELCLVVLDADLCGELDADWEADLEACEPIAPGAWKRRGVLQRAAEWIGKLVRPEV